MKKHLTFSWGYPPQTRPAAVTLAPLLTVVMWGREQLTPPDGVQTSTDLDRPLPYCICAIPPTMNRAINSKL